MNKLFIIVGIVVLVMIGVVWKSNSDRKAREEALALQTQQHNQKMAQIEAENQARLAQEAKDKPKKSKLVLRATNKQRLNRRILIKIIKLLVIKLLLSKVKAIRLLVTILSRNINTQMRSG
jgi:Flp pilus assembly protein TadB